MADATVSQFAVEYLAAEEGRAVASQVAVEYLAPPLGPAHVSQFAVEYLFPRPLTYGQFTLPAAQQGIEGPLLWIEFAHPALPSTLAFSILWIADPATYYHGFKEARLLRIDDLVYGYSDISGDLQVTALNFEMSDILDHTQQTLVRTWLGTVDERALRRVEITMRMISDPARRLFLTPVTVFRGRIEEYDGLDEYRVAFRCLGWINKYKNRPVLPHLIGDIFPQAPIATRTLRVPVALGDLSDEGSATAGPVLVDDEAGRGGNGEPDPTNSFGDIGASAPTNLAIAEDPGNGNLMLGQVAGNQFFVFVTRVVAGVESDPEPFLPGATTVTITGDNAAISATCDNDGADSYRFYIGDFYFGPRVKYYLETTDPVTGVLFTDHPGLTITPGGVYALQDFGYAVVLAVMADGRTAYAPTPARAFMSPAGYIRPVRFAWTPIPGAIEYEVYAVMHPTDPFDRKWVVPTSQVNSNGDVYWEWLWGANDWTAVSGVPLAQGRIEPRYCGMFTDVEGFPYWHGWIISGRPGEAFEGAYLGGVRIPDADFDVDAAAPGVGSGFATWFSASPYYPIGGLNTFMIFLRGPKAHSVLGYDDAGQPFTPQVDLRVNVRGLESAGDGSGACITSIYQQMAKLAPNLLLHDAPSLAGPWTANPTFSDGTPRVDLPSLVQAEADALDVIPSGPDGGRWIADDITVGQLLAEWARSARARHGTNEDGQWGAAVSNPSATPVYSVEAAEEVLAGSFGFRDAVQGLATRIVQRFNARYDADGSYDLQDERTDSSSLDSEFQEPPTAMTQELVWRFSAAIAAEIGQSILVEVEQMPRTVTMESVLHWLHVRLGTHIDVTHPQGPASGGWNRRLIQVLGKRLSPSQLKVGLTCLDLREDLP